MFQNRRASAVEDYLIASRMFGSVKGLVGLLRRTGRDGLVTISPDLAPQKGHREIVFEHGNMTQMTANGIGFGEITFWRTILRGLHVKARLRNRSQIRHC